jgi:hypothetical protein
MSAGEQPIVVSCKCGRSFQAQPYLVGKQVACPVCRSAIYVAPPQASARPPSSEHPFADAHAPSPAAFPGSYVQAVAPQAGAARRKTVGFPMAVVYAVLGIAGVLFLVCAGIFGYGFVQGLMEGFENVRREAELRDSAGTSEPAGTFPAGPPATRTVSDTTSGSQTVDLLKEFEPQRDQVRGEFVLDSRGLTLPATQAALIEFPVSTPPSYRLELEAERTSGQDSLNLIVVVAERPVMIVLEGFEKKLSGLNVVNGRSANQNETTYRQPIFAAGRPTTIVCTVQGNHVVVRCDGKTVIDWQGDPSQLSLDKRYWKPRTPGQLAIGTWNTEFLITRCELSPLPDASQPALGDVAVDSGGSSPEAPPGSGGPWQTLGGDEWGFVAEVPPNATIDESGETHPAGSPTTFSAASDGEAFAVKIWKLSAPTNQPMQYVQDIQRRVVAKRGRVIDQRLIDVRGARAGSEMSVIDNRDFLQVTRIILVEDRFYELVYIGDKSQRRPPQMLRFFSSFQLL